MLPELKGPGKLIAVAITEKFTLELIRFMDHSWAIRKQGMYLDVWEPDRVEECWKLFYQLSCSGADYLLQVAPRDCDRRHAVSRLAEHMN